jgi:hypothetical protein
VAHEGVEAKSSLRRRTLFATISGGWCYVVEKASKMNIETLFAPKNYGGRKNAEALAWVRLSGGEG